MSHRMTILARTAGAIGIAGGVLLTWAAWAVTLPTIEVSRLVVPQLLVTEPLVWLGVSLVLSPSLARLLAERAADTATTRLADSAAYINCPECEQLVRVSADHCPYCGEPLVGPPARHAY